MAGTETCPVTSDSLAEQRNSGLHRFHDLPDDLILPFCPTDQNAVWALWFRHKDRLEQVLRSLSSLSAWDKEEILSSASLRLHAQLPRHAASIRNLTAWMCTLVRNVAMDYLRKERRFHQRHLQLENEDGSPKEMRHTARAASCSLELQEAVQFGLESLSARLRETAAAHFVEGKSYSEIARAQQITMAAARKRIQAARTQLKKAVRNYMPEISERKPAEISQARESVILARNGAEIQHYLKTHTQSKQNVLENVASNN